MKSSKGLLISPFRFNGGIPDRVQRLFVEMAEHPDKPVEYVDEILRAGMTGRIDLDSEFNLYGYCHKIKTTGNMSAVKKQLEKETYIAFDSSDFEGTAKSGGVQANKLTPFIEEYDAIEDKAELDFAVNMISQLHNDLLVQEGINIPVLIKRALVGVPQAIAGLKKVCDEFEILGEYIKVVLEAGSKGVDIDSLALC